MNTKLKTKRGKLTRYAFLCGYVEKYDKDDYNRVTMSLEPNGFHFKGFIHGDHFWTILEDADMKGARKFFSKLIKRINKEPMKTYMVLYRIESIMSPLDSPFGFKCQADDSDHAEEQCINAYPDCDVVWIVEVDDYQSALDNYYYTEMENSDGQ